jgi:hypothetical protein
MIELKIEQGYGNPFVQSIHDGVTLDNHKKNQAFGLQMVDPNWLCNLVICVGFHRSTNGTNIGVAKLFEDIVFEHTGCTLKSILASMVSDCAAIGVSTVAGMEKQEGCDMHDSDKVGKSAIGDLV